MSAGACCMVHDELSSSPVSTLSAVRQDSPRTVTVTVAVVDPRTPVAVGDPATFFGLAPEGGPGIRVETQAEAGGTLAYELFVGVGDRVPRVYVDGESAGD